MGSQRTLFMVAAVVSETTWFLLQRVPLSTALADRQGLPRRAVDVLWQHCYTALSHVTYPGLKVGVSWRILVMKRVTRNQLCTSFSAAHPPVLRVQPGEPFVMETNDRFATYEGPNSSP